MSQDDTTRQISGWDAAAIGILGTVGAVLSYDALQQMAVAMHVRGPLTYLFPAVIDGFIAYGVRALLVLREAPWPARAYAWSLFTGATSTSIWANALHAVRLNEQTSLNQGLRLPNTAVGFLSTLAPLALGGAVHLYIVMARHAPKRGNRSEGEVAAEPTGERDVQHRSGTARAWLFRTRRTMTLEAGRDRNVSRDHLKAADRAAPELPFGTPAPPTPPALQTGGGTSIAPPPGTGTAPGITGPSGTGTVLGSAPLSGTGLGTVPGSGPGGAGLAGTGPSTTTGTGTVPPSGTATTPGQGTVRSAAGTLGGTVVGAGVGTVLPPGAGTVPSPGTVPPVRTGTVPPLGTGTVPQSGVGTVPSPGTVPPVRTGTVAPTGTAVAVGTGTVPPLGTGTVPQSGAGTVPSPGTVPPVRTGTVAPTGTAVAVGTGTV
ncbi:DUF2637 domain-containing protein, partial [Kitasatospora sp. GAS1066B]|uniref:DUF2637 domain-containing protein n=1 Tax=Kitasatospora sp. GAS1066B TaxID=3156271 RepID=UPI003511B48A